MGIFPKWMSTIYMPDTCRGQKRALGPLEMDGYVVGPMWVLGTELRALQEQQMFWTIPILLNFVASYPCVHCVEVGRILALWHAVPTGPSHPLHTWALFLKNFLFLVFFVSFVTSGVLRKPDTMVSSALRHLISAWSRKTGTDGRSGCSDDFGQQFLLHIPCSCWSNPTSSCMRWVHWSCLYE